MKNFSLLLLLFFIICFSSLGLYAQDLKNEKIDFKNSLTFNTLGVVTRHAIFGYERNINDKNTIRLSVGFKYSTADNSFKSHTIGLLTFKFYNRVSKGNYIGVGYNYTFLSFARLYLSAELYYNYIYYDKIYYQFCVGTDSDSYVSLESFREKSKGIKFVFGKKLTLLSGNKVGLEFDFFVSAGIAHRNQELLTHAKRQGTCSLNAEMQKFNPPKVNTTENWVTTINIGALISMPF